MTFHDFFNSVVRAKWTKLSVFALCLAPMAYLAWEGRNVGRNVNFMKMATCGTGDWALNFLVLTVAISPLRQIFRLPELIRFRRMLGLFSFFYACLHLLSWARLHHLPGVAQFNAWNLRLAMLGFILMIPLAATSTTASIRWLGGKRWQTLHRLVYVSVLLSIAHYYGIAGPNIGKPITYGAVIMLLLLFRIRKRAAASRHPTVN